MKSLSISVVLLHDGGDRVGERLVVGMDDELRERRRRLEAARVGAHRPDGIVAPEVLASWQRCAPHVAMHLDRVPTVDEDVVRDAWQESRIRRVGDALLDELRTITEHDDLLAAITDSEGTVLWSHGNRRMSRIGESVNFVPGGRWSEQNAGTNALGMALTAGRPATVFSSEHWCDAVTDWVCYAAPVMDPATGVPLGVIDLSSSWEKTSALGLTTVRTLARLAEAQLSLDAGEAASPWRLRLSGRGELTHHGDPVPLTTRQIEILATIALHDGLTLDELHAHVYGDRAVSMSTLKAEVSHIRKRLDDLILSRPYRLGGPLAVAVDEILDALDHKDLAKALDRYRGPVMPQSESPYLSARGHHLDVVLRDAVIRSGDLAHVRRFAELHPDETDLLLG